MNRTQEKHLDDLVKRFSAEGQHKLAPEVKAPDRASDVEIVGIRPRTVIVLALPAIAFIYLLIVF